MKKILIILLSIICLFGLVGCLNDPFYVTNNATDSLVIQGE